MYSDESCRITLMLFRVAKLKGSGSGMAVFPVP